MDSVFILLKCPYYGFLKITFHAVCNTALSEWKHPGKFSIWKCTVYEAIVSQKKESTLNHWNESFVWENLIFALVWMKMQIHSLPLGAAFGEVKIAVSLVTAVHKAALCSQTLLYQALQAWWNENEIDQSDQSPQLSITQRRGLEQWIVERIVWESLS